MRTRYEPRVAGAQTPDEMRRLAQPDGRRAERVAPGRRGGGGGGGRAAADRPRAGSGFASIARSTSATAGCKVTEVIPLGPAAVTRQVAVGDYVIDGRRHAAQRAA